MCPQLSPSGSCDSVCWGLSGATGAALPTVGQAGYTAPHPAGGSHQPTAPPAVGQILSLPHLLLGINSISQLPTVCLARAPGAPPPTHRAKSKLPVRMTNLSKPLHCLSPASSLPSLLLPRGFQSHSHPCL